ncbi:MAG TPA: segregation/condensation protein A [Planctomycetota bacterium]|nr:segregation/condensation protein A [Planctomycetota bacterium]
MPAPTDTAPRTVVGSRVDFSAKLEEFQGPLDLLLYLIKENEVDIANIPIARVLEQYLRFMDQAGQWDLQLAGEFLVMAVTLMEIKSRELLPMQEQPAGEEDEELIEDPRSELVRQLLEYRRLKDQAKALELLAEWWQGHHPRGMDDDIPEPESGDPEADRSAAREALVDVDLYALFAAFEKMMKAVLAQQPRNIVLDSESIEDRIARIEHSLKARPFARFIELVVNPLDRGDIAATFFALLELLRRRSIRLVQHGPYGSFDVKSRDPNSPDDEARTEMEAAEAADRDALKAKAEQDALAAQGIETAGGRFHFTRKRMPPRPKFEGIVRPEDVEEIDAEEVEIGRRIDAILAAADAISERFEQSREGRAREEQPPETQPPQSQTPPPEEKKE